MDYEKLYKEALERARDLYDNHPYGEPPQYITCEEIFPELKESEDEKIRKGLLNMLSQDYELHKRETAWLEKQGHDGKKWIYEDEYIKDKEQTFQDGIDEVLGNPQKYGLEKQGEQKSTWSEEDEKIIKRIDSLLYSQCAIHGSEYEELHKWLKSLKPNHWKPSEEQMEALNAINTIGEISYIKQGNLLIELYNELKKL